jgi:hypothetical protein
VATINTTTELYDPTTDTWQLTNGLPLLPGRFNFQQAVLPNGEVYDPVTGTWLSAGTMTHQHGTSSSLTNTHDAVVLSANPWTFEFGAACGTNCGKVLVLGDSLTDPVADLYTPTAPVPTSAEQCMDNGFKGRSTADYVPFRNQGQCIKHVRAGSRGAAAA